MPTTATRPTTFAWPARRVSTSASTDQKPLYLSSGHGTEQWPDTIATDFGSADAVGDDQAERHSNWGALQECAVEGGRHHEPSNATRNKKPSVLPWLLWPLGAVSAIAAVAAFWS